MKAKFTFLFTAILFLSNAMKAQENTIEIEVGNSGPVKVHAIYHASMIVEAGSKMIYVDPHGGQDLYANYRKPDLVIITDIHPDHYDKLTLEGLVNDKTEFIVPAAVFELLTEKWKKKSQVVANGGMADKFGMVIAAVPMYNLPEKSDSYHVKGRGNGYIIEKGDLRIYISGDTEDIPEMMNLKNIDLAFICMNQPYTMTVDQAADAVGAFKPRMVCPYHYRNGDKSLSDIRRFGQMAEDAGSDVRILNWYSH